MPTAETEYPWPPADEARALLRHGRGAGVKIAVIDSGVETAHPLLAGLRLADDVAITDDGVKLSMVDGQGRDVFGHGTAITSILRQIAPEAQIGSFRALGERLRSRSQIVRLAARLAMERGYHILNCSFGCAREDQALFYKDWIDEAYVQGRHIVAACNNHDPARREWPGHFPTVIAVNFAACADVATFFHRPGGLVEFAARGQDIQVAWLGGGTKQVTGSSFAAPHLTGLLARLLSGRPNLSPLAAKTLLQFLATQAK